MSIFDALPVDGTAMSVAALTEKLQVDEELINKLLNLQLEEYSSHLLCPLVRLVRVVVSILFKELSPETYTHTLNPRIYLDPIFGAMFKTPLVQY
jgi:hypothetical protein